MQALTKQNKLLKQLIETLERQNQSRNQEKDTLLLQIENLVAEINTLSKKPSISQTNSHQQELLNIRIKQLQAKNEYLEADCINLCQDKQYLENMIRQFEQQNIRLKEQVTVNKKEQGNRIIETNSGELVQKNKEIDELMKRNMEYERKLLEESSKFEKVIHDYDKQVNEHKKTIQALQDQLNNRKFTQQNVNKDEANKKQAQFQILREKIRNQQNEILEIKKAQKQTEIANISKQSLDVKKLKGENSELKDKLQWSNKEVQSLKSRIRSLQVTLTTKTAELATKLNLNQQANILKQQLQYRNEENNILNNMINDQKQQIQYYEQKSATLEAQIQQIMQGNSELVTQNQENSELIIEMRNKIEELQLLLSRNTSSRQQLRNHSKKGRQQYQLEVQKKNMENYEHELEQKNRENKNLISLITNLKKENQEIRKNLFNENTSNCNGQQVRENKSNQDKYSESTSNLHKRHINQRRFAEDQHQPEDIRSIIRSLQGELKQVKTDFSKISQQNHKMHQYIKKKFENQESHRNFNEQSHSALRSPERTPFFNLIHQSKSRLTQNSTLPRYEQLIHDSSQNLSRIPKQHLTNVGHKFEGPVRDIRNSSTNPRFENEPAQKSVKEKKKLQKWGNLQRRISQLQQENRELKRTMQE